MRLKIARVDIGRRHRSPSTPFDSREEACLIQSRIQTSRGAPRTVARPAFPALTTAVLTVGLMVGPRAPRTVARPVFPALTTAVPTAVLTVVPTVVLDNRAASFEHYQH